MLKARSTGKASACKDMFQSFLITQKVVLLIFASCLYFPSLSFFAFVSGGLRLFLKINYYAFLIANCKPKIL